MALVPKDSDFLQENTKYFSGKEKTMLILSMLFL
jgi:hypothetical protein